MKASMKPSEGSVKRYVSPDGSKMKPVKACRMCRMRMVQKNVSSSVKRVTDASSLEWDK